MWENPFLNARDLIIASEERDVSMFDVLCTEIDPTKITRSDVTRDLINWLQGATWLVECRFLANPLSGIMVGS